MFGHVVFCRFSTICCEKAQYTETEWEAFFCCVNDYCLCANFLQNKEGFPSEMVKICIFGKSPVKNADTFCNAARWFPALPF